MEKNNERDDILFEQLRKAKRRKRRRVIITVLVLLLLAGGGIFTAVRVLRERVRTQFQTGTVEVKSYEAQVGRISTTVSGSGTLSYTGHEEINVPEGVTVEELKVSAGDIVQAGDVLATVDVNTVLTALADTQTELADLDKKIDSAKNDTVNASLSTAVSGRVKKLFAQEGDNVVDVMTEHGALALISLDGLMTVTVDAALETGSKVTVVSDEVSYKGTVESSVAGKSVVALTDDGPKYDAPAEVLDEEGNVLGSGRLAIRSPISITGYAGTVSWLNVRENQTVYSGSGIYTLTNTQYTANYDTLLRTRGEKEKQINQLIELLRSGTVTAPFDGIVTEVNDPNTETAPSEASAYLAAAAAPSSGALVTVAPNREVVVSVSVDETDILSLEIGQEAEIKVSSVSDEAYPGKVTEIPKIGTSASGVTQYSAVVTLERQAQMLSGMTASVDIQIRGVDDVVLIPVDALHQTRNTYYVYTGYHEDLQEYDGLVEVTVGESNSSFVEIVSGLKPGDTVYYTEKSTNSFFGSMPMGNWGGFGNTGGNRTGNTRSGSGSNNRGSSQGGSRTGMGG